MVQLTTGELGNLPEPAPTRPPPTPAPPDHSAAIIASVTGGGLFLGGLVACALCSGQIKNLSKKFGKNSQKNKKAASKKKGSKKGDKGKSKKKRKK